MSDQDDFFGIKYVTNTQIPQKILPRRAPSNRNEGDGTEFLDKAFFPEIDEKEDESGYRKIFMEEHTSNYIDEQFFSNKSRPSSQKPLEESSEPLSKKPRRPKPSISKAETYNKEFEDSPEIITTAAYTEFSGIRQIWSLIDPVWKMTREELVRLMVERVIYEDDELIAFDKPYQMAYSTAFRNQPKLKPLLNDIKNIIAPECEGFYLVKPIDKYVSGVMLFSKSRELKKKWMKILENGQIEMQYQILVKGVPKQEEALIKIPLKKFDRGGNLELRPYVEGTPYQNVFRAETEYRVVNSDKNTYVSLLDVKVRREVPVEGGSVPHQIRSHLGYGLGCPIIGDTTYTEMKLNMPPRVSAKMQYKLELTRNDFHRLPMYIHTKQMMISPRGKEKSTISMVAPIPQFFRYTLKKLSLLKR